MVFQQYCYFLKCFKCRKCNSSLIAKLQTKPILWFLLPWAVAVIPSLHHQMAVSNRRDSAGQWVHIMLDLQQAGEIRFAFNPLWCSVLCDWEQKAILVTSEQQPSGKLNKCIITLEWKATDDVRAVFFFPLWLNSSRLNWPKPNGVKNQCYGTKQQYQESA